MRNVLVLAITTAVLVGGLASVALADPNVPNISAHRHFLETPSGGLVEVGPRLCDDSRRQNGFNQFHINFHSSATSPTTPIDTLGPQHGAPGIHDISNGAALVIRPCSFSP
jgi:hypothetical protein